MPALTLHNVETVSAVRPFLWEGDVQVGTNTNRARFTVQHRENALALKAFGGRYYPPFPFAGDTAPKWEDIQSLIEEGLRQLMMRDTFQNFAEVQNWTLEETEAPVSGAVEDTPVKITVRYRDGYKNRPVVVALREIPLLLANPQIAGIDVERATGAP